MTKPIPAGTCQFTANIPMEERFLLGQLVEAERISLAEFWRRCSQAYLDMLNPEMAARLRTIRREAAKVACLVIALVAIGQGWLRQDDLLRKAPRTARVVRTTKRGRREEVA